MTAGECFVGIDIGGSGTKVLIARAEDATAGALAPRQHASFTVPGALHVDSIDALVRRVFETVPELRIAGVGVAVPGVIDDALGDVVRSVNLPWLERYPLTERIADELRAPVALVNDGRAAALAEARHGSGAGLSDVFVIALGTGIAGAHVVDGEVRSGSHGAAGELGHVSIDPAGVRCGCGQRGCIETLIGAPALLRRWNERSAGGLRELFEAERDGDRYAVEIVGTATSALARGLLGLIAISDPGLIVIGGGVSEGPSPIVDHVRTKTMEAATFHTIPDIVPARLGRLAGAWGAVLAAEDSSARSRTALAEQIALTP